MNENYLQGWQEASLFLQYRNDAQKYKLKHGEGKCPPGQHLVVPKDGDKPFCRHSQGRENEVVKPKKSSNPAGWIVGGTLGALALGGGITALAVAGGGGEKGGKSPVTEKPSQRKTTPPSTKVSPEPTKQTPVTEASGNKKETTPPPVQPKKINNPQGTTSPVTERPQEKETKPPSVTISPNTQKQKKSNEEIAEDYEKELQQKEIQRKSQKGQVLIQEDNIPYVQSLNKDVSIYGATFADNEEQRLLKDEDYKTLARQFLDESPERKQQLVSNIIGAYRKLGNTMSEKQIKALQGSEFPSEETTYLLLKQMGKTGKPKVVSSDIINKEVQNGALQLYQGKYTTSNEEMKLAQSKLRNGEYHIQSNIHLVGMDQHEREYKTFESGTNWHIGDDDAIETSKLQALYSDAGMPRWNGAGQNKNKNLGQNLVINRGAIDKSAKLANPLLLKAISEEIASNPDDNILKGLNDDERITLGYAISNLEILGASLGFDGFVYSFHDADQKAIANLFNTSKLLLDKNTYYL